MATSPVALYYAFKELLKEFKLLKRDRRERYDTIDDMRLTYSGKRTDGGVIIIDKEITPPWSRMVSTQPQSSTF